MIGLKFELQEQLQYKTVSELMSAHQFVAISIGTYYNNSNINIIYLLTSPARLTI